MKTTKLTLSVDRDLVQAAKALAAESRTSLSAMVSRFVEGVLRERQTREPLGPLTRKALGLVKRPPGKTDPELLEDALQYHSALHARAKFLVTRNPADFPRSPLAICSPGELLAKLAGD